MVKPEELKTGQVIRLPIDCLRGRVGRMQVFRTFDMAGRLRIDGWRLNRSGIPVEFCRGWADEVISIIKQPEEVPHA